MSPVPGALKVEHDPFHRAGQPASGCYFHGNAVLIGASPCVPHGLKFSFQIQCGVRNVLHTWPHGFSARLPPFQNMHFNSIKNAKLTISVNISVTGYMR